MVPHQKPFETIYCFQINDAAPVLSRGLRVEVLCDGKTGCALSNIPEVFAKAKWLHHHPRFLLFVSWTAVSIEPHWWRVISLRPTFNFLQRTHFLSGGADTLVIVAGDLSVVTLGLMSLNSSCRDILECRSVTSHFAPSRVRGKRTPGY